MNNIVLEITAPLLEIFSDWCVILIVGLFIVWISIFWYRCGKQRRNFKEAKTAVEKSDRLISVEGFANWETTTKFRGYISDNSSAWDDFKATFIYVDEGSENNNVYRTESASLFFTEDRLLTDALNLRFWNSVPSLLVGIGILGTFVGLVLGLRGFNVEDTKTIQTLLGGMQTAFISSVVGMSVSLVFSGVEKAHIHMINKAILKLQSALDSKFQYKPR